MATNLACAHSLGFDGEWEELAVHLKRVSEKATLFDWHLGAAQEAELATILNDAGRFDANVLAGLWGNDSVLWRRSVERKPYAF